MHVPSSRLKKRQTEMGVMESFLDKRGHNVKNWKKRYFVLNENRKVISYFMTSEKKNKKGSLKIMKVFELPARPDQPGKREHRFDFHGQETSSRAEISICVAAESLDLKERWLEALHDSIEIKKVSGSRGSTYGIDAISSPDMGSPDQMGGISEDDFGALDFDGVDATSDIAGDGLVSPPDSLLLQSSNEKVDLDEAYLDAKKAAKESRRQRSSLKASKLMGTTEQELLDKPTKEGYLSIKTGLQHGITSAWNDFYFVFDGISRMLSWFKSNDQKKMYGYMEVLVMFDVPNRRGKRLHRLEFYGVMKDSACGYLSVSAKTPEDKQSWYIYITSYNNTENHASRRNEISFNSYIFFP